MRDRAILIMGGHNTQMYFVCIFYDITFLNSYIVRRTQNMKYNAFYYCILAYSVLPRFLVYSLCIYK